MAQKDDFFSTLEQAEDDFFSTLEEPKKKKGELSPLQRQAKASLAKLKQQDAEEYATSGPKLLQSVAHSGVEAAQMPVRVLAGIAEPFRQGVHAVNEQFPQLLGTKPLERFLGSAKAKLEQDEPFAEGIYPSADRPTGTGAQLAEALVSAPAQVASLMATLPAAEAAIAPKVAALLPKLSPALQKIATGATTFGGLGAAETSAAGGSPLEVVEEAGKQALLGAVMEGAKPFGRAVRAGGVGTTAAALAPEGQGIQSGVTMGALAGIAPAEKTKSPGKITPEQEAKNRANEQKMVEKEAETIIEKSKKEAEQEAEVHAKEVDGLRRNLVAQRAMLAVDELNALIPEGAPITNKEAILVYAAKRKAFDDLRELKVPEVDQADYLSQVEQLAKHKASVANPPKVELEPPPPAGEPPPLVVDQPLAAKMLMAKVSNPGVSMDATVLRLVQKLADPGNPFSSSEKLPLEVQKSLVRLADNLGVDLKPPESSMGRSLDLATGAAQPRLPRFGSPPPPPFQGEGAFSYRGPDMDARLRAMQGLEFDPSKLGGSREGIRAGEAAPEVQQQAGGGNQGQGQAGPESLGPIPPAAKVPTAEAAPVKPAKFSIPEETHLQHVQRTFQDKLNRVGTYQREIGKATGKPTRDIKGTVDAFTAKTAAKIQDVDTVFLEPLVKTLSAEKLTPEQLGDYVYAKHAPTGNAVLEFRHDGKVLDGTGMSNADAAKILADFDAKGLTPKLEKGAAIVRAMREEQVKVMVDGGLISKGEADAWLKLHGEDYVPVRTEDVEAGIGMGQGFGIRGKESKSRTGRKSRADNPVLFMAQQLERAIVRAEKNKTDIEFANFVKEHPDPSLWEMNKKHTTTEIGPDGKAREVGDPSAALKDFTYKVNGETQRITLKDPLMDRAMKNLSDKEMGNFLRGIGSATRVYGQLATTWNAEFMGVNFARDLQEALANVGVEHGAKMAAGVAKNVPSSLRDMFKYHFGDKTDPSFQGIREFREDGGAVGWYSVKTIPELERSIAGRVKSSGPGAANAIHRSLGGIKRAVEAANASVEGATRYSVYRALRENGVPRAKAGNVARNVTIDFTKKGEVGPAIGALYSFANANIQGGKRIIDIVRTPTGKKLAAAIVSSGFVLDQYNRAMAGDADGDEENDYDAIPDYVKDHNLIFVRGKGKKPITIPMPYGYSAIHSYGRLASAAMSGAISPVKAATHAASATINAFNPLGDSPNITQALSPTLADPFVQSDSNQKFSGAPIMPTRFPNDTRPDSELYWPDVNPVAKWIATGLNSATGGTAKTPGHIDVSPETFEHYFAFVTGGPGRLVANTWTTASALAKGETPSLRKVPFARRFTYEPRQKSDEEKAKERKRRALESAAR